MREFELIEKIRDMQKISDRAVIRGIGDDCAVIDRGGYYELVGADSLVCGDHFRLEWSSAQDVGHKAMISNLSDIAAMGGEAKYAFCQLCIPSVIFDEWVEGFYRGLKSSAVRVPVLGGDITHGENLVISLTILGEVTRDKCCFRSGARVGDLICVTGNLGASSAGLEILKGGYVHFKRSDDFRSTGGRDIKFFNDFSSKFANAAEFCVLKHLRPSAQSKVAPVIARYASAMIDVSDGLASEVKHICEESGVGALVNAEKIPIDDRVKEVGDFLKKDFLSFALRGGEDFELVFTVSEDKLGGLMKDLAKFRVPVTVVGKIFGKKEGVMLRRHGRKIVMPSGFVHF